MTDRIDKATRSRNMSAIRGSNTVPEMTVRRFLHKSGFRYRIQARELPGKPDLVFPRYRVAIFVHGCFWHHHSGCKAAVMPSTNAEFWRKKIYGTIERDARAQQELTADEWRVMTVWECEINDANLGALADQIRRLGPWK